MAHMTSPSGLATFVASAISKADLIKTGIQAFKYAMLTATLPPNFIFNTDVILYCDDFWTSTDFIFTSTLIVMILFSSANHDYLFTNNKKIEAKPLLAAAFLVRPNALLDIYKKPYTPGTVLAFFQEMKASQAIEFIKNVSYEDFDSEIKHKLAILSTNSMLSEKGRLIALVIEVIKEHGKTIVKLVSFTPLVQKADFDQEIINRRARILIYRLLYSPSPWTNDTDDSRLISPMKLSL